MNFLFFHQKLDAVLPGVVEAYKKLRSTDNVGIYTSNGEFYNHTFFGRDASMTAKFVCDFDHEVAIGTIDALARYQGVATNGVTGEQPGKIHHELRDFTTWRGTWPSRIAFYGMRLAWGAKRRQLLTYYSDDSTATYIRLVYKYAKSIDKSFVNHQYKDKNAQYRTIAESVEAAANWVTSCVTSDGLFVVKRTNRWALPFQIFQDSVTAYTWRDGKIANFRHDISYVEAQAYAIDALRAASRLLPTNQHERVWRDAAEAMRTALLRDFWSDDTQYLASSMSRRDGVLRPLDVPTISAGFALNASFWKVLPEEERAKKIAGVVERLFSSDFLTDVGLRTRSKQYAAATKNHVEYHDHQTVWPMFNFMVIEGLRRHRLYRLAEQLEARLLRAAKTIDGFQEFYIVETDGTVCQPVSDALRSLSVQMKPEREIAFTVVPMLTLARRKATAPARLEQANWQAELEQKIIDRLPVFDADTPLAVQPVKLKRSAAGVTAFTSLLFKTVRR